MENKSPILATIEQVRDGSTYRVCLYLPWIWTDLSIYQALNLLMGFAVPHRKGCQTVHIIEPFELQQILCRNQASSKKNVWGVSAKVIGTAISMKYFWAIIWRFCQKFKIGHFHGNVDAMNLRDARIKSWKTNPCLERPRSQNLLSNQNP
jgi:hypothetical protein